MADVESMAIRKTRDYLPKQSNRFFFGERTVSRYIIEKLATFDVFENQIAIKVSSQARAVVYLPQLTVRLGSPRCRID